MAIRCLTDAHVSRLPAELVVNLNGTEGEQLVRYVRVLADGSAEVFFDDRHDPRSSAGWSYQGNCRELQTSPFEVVAAKSCDPAVALA